MLNGFISMVRANWKTALSITFVLIAVMDTFVTSISTIAATFLGLAALPWLLGLFEKVTLPGGIELDLKKIEEKLNANPSEVHDEDRDAFKYLQTDDPNLAMAALRIEIERRLRKIASARNLVTTGERNGITQLLRVLGDNGVVGHNVSSLILDMLPTLNAAAHGANLPSSSDEWVLSNGPKLLSLLDEKL
ncbi:hypothetical protein [Yoonia maritima]|nr:hypothetical protein [Yoonia maritima]